MKLKQKTPKTDFKYGYGHYPLYVRDYNLTYDYNERLGVSISGRETGSLLNFLSECLKDPKKNKKKELSGLTFEWGQGHLSCWNKQQQNRIYLTIITTSRLYPGWAALTLRQARSLVKFLERTRG